MRRVASEQAREARINGENAIVCAEWSRGKEGRAITAYRGEGLVYARFPVAGSCMLVESASFIAARKVCKSISGEK